jgi:arylsulfatase A-like enzyme
LFKQASQNLSLQRILIVAVSSSIGAVIYSMYDFGVTLAEMQIPLNILQQTLCMLLNAIVLGAVGFALAIPFAVIPFKKGNENWIGFVTGFVGVYSLSGYIFTANPSNKIIWLVVFICGTLGVSMFAVVREISEKLKMGSVLFICFASVGSLAGYVPGTPNHGAPLANAPNVLIITIDGLRFDYLASNGHPYINTDGFDELVARGVSLQNAFVQSDDPDEFYDHLILGKEPWETKGLKENVGQYFQRLGYRTGAFVSSPSLIGRYKKGFDIYDDDFAWFQGISRSLGGTLINQVVPFVMEERLAEHSTENLLQWLAQDTDRPFFALLQLSDPQWPYTPPAPWSEDYYSDNPRDPNKETLHLDSLSDEMREDVKGIIDTTYITSQYAGEVAYVSRQIEIVLLELEQQMKLDNTCIVLTSSIGVTLGEENRWFSQSKIIDSSVFQVPLIVSFPTILPKNTTNDAVIEVADIIPTLFELLAQESFSSVSAKGMANVLYGASGRTHARSLGSFENKRVPALFIDSNTSLWIDEEEQFQNRGEFQIIDSFQAELTNFNKKIKNTSE